MRTTASHRPGHAPLCSMSPLAGVLNRQWRRDVEDRGAPVPAAWRTDVRLERYRRVVDVLAALEDAATPPEAAERILCSLTELATTGDHEAARVVVQYLLPCFVQVASRRSRTSARSREELLDDLLTTAWMAVLEGLTPRGLPTKIAVLRTVEYRALQGPERAARRRSTREVLVGDVGRLAGRCTEPVDLQGRPASVEQHADEVWADVLGDAVRRGFARSDARFIGELFVGGSTCEGIAADEGITSRAVRYRRASAVQRLVEWSA